MRTGFRTVPANHHVVPDVANTNQLPNGLANVNIIAIHAKNTFQANAVRKTTNNKRLNVQALRGQQSATNIRFKLMSAFSMICRTGRPR